MILQTDPELNEEIATFGCYFCSCLYHAERLTGHAMDSTRVLAIFTAAKQTGIILEDCFVNDPISLLSLAGVNVSTVLKVDKTTNPSDHGFELLHFHRDADTPTGMGNAVHDHFVAGDGTGKVAFDSLGLSNTVKYGYLEDKRIFS